MAAISLDAIYDIDLALTTTGKWHVLVWCGCCLSPLPSLRSPLLPPRTRLDTPSPLSNPPPQTRTRNNTPPSSKSNTRPSSKSCKSLPMPTSVS